MQWDFFLFGPSFDFVDSANLVCLLLGEKVQSFVLLCFVLVYFDLVWLLLLVVVVLLVLFKSAISVQLCQRRGAMGWCCFFNCKGSNAYTPSYNRSHK